MFLRIQPEESLRSFIARNFYVNRYSPLIAELKKDSNFAVSNYEIKKIGRAMGWLGCYGFNRLLHNHIYYPRKAFLHKNEDLSYSGWEYCSSGSQFELAKEPSRFCPECVRGDIASLGFSYWRRVHHPDIKVCATHNVYLEEQCPFCLMPFSSKNHDLDVMWKGCKGLHLSHTPSRRNYKFTELKKARFFRDIFSFDSVISIEAARLALRERACERWPYLREKLVAAEQWHEFIDLLKGEFGDDWNLACGIYNDVIYGLALTLYDGFQDFLNHIKCYDYRLRKVESLWSTYATGEYLAVQYIREDYVYGVGHWSCTFSPKEISDARGDWYGRPVEYPCCNHVPSLYKTRPLRPDRVRSAPPGVPILARHPSEY